MPVLVRIDARDALAFTARPEPRSSDHTGEIWYLLRRYLLSRNIGYPVRAPVSTLLEPSIDLSRNVDLVSRRAESKPAAHFLLLPGALVDGKDEAGRARVSVQLAGGIR